MGTIQVGVHCRGLSTLQSVHYRRFHCNSFPVSPDAIHEHVKTKQLEHKARLHYTAPEYAGDYNTTSWLHNTA